MTRRRWTGWWYGGCAGVVAVASAALAVVFDASPWVIASAGLVGAVVGVVLATEILEGIVFAASLVGLDDDGPHFPRTRAFVQRIDDMLDGQP
jgi:hypothetical protein